MGHHAPRIIHDSHALHSLRAPRVHNARVVRCARNYLLLLRKVGATLVGVFYYIFVLAVEIMLIRKRTHTRSHTHIHTRARANQIRVR